MANAGFTVESMRCRIRCTAPTAAMCISGHAGISTDERKTSGAASAGFGARRRRLNVDHGRLMRQILKDWWKVHQTSESII